MLVLFRMVAFNKPVRDLLDAASVGRRAAVLRAVDTGVPVDSADRRQWTPLMFAAAAGDAEFGRQLLARHANINARNSNGDTALLLALWNRHPAVAEMLIAAGADARLANDDGRTALFAAAMHGDSAVCKLLLDRGAARGRRDREGKTALDYAKEEGHSDVEALLSASTPPLL